MGKANQLILFGIPKHLCLTQLNNFMFWRIFAIFVVITTIIFTQYQMSLNRKESMVLFCASDEAHKIISESTQGCYTLLNNIK